MEPITAIFEAGKMAIERIWPDPNERAEQQRKLEALHQKGDLAEMQLKVGSLMEQMKSQTKINEIDAKSGNFFQYGWRPMVGWVCSISLALTYITKALVGAYIWTLQQLTILNRWDGKTELVTTGFPDLGTNDLIGLLLGLLGIAGMRSFDKLKGIDTKK